jgi:hypothetical protein
LINLAKCKTSTRDDTLLASPAEYYPTREFNTMKSGILFFSALTFASASALWAGGEMISRKVQNTTTERFVPPAPPYPPELECRWRAMRAAAAAPVWTYYHPVPAMPYEPCAPYGVPGGFGYNPSDMYPNIGFGIAGSGPRVRLY